MSFFPDSAVYFLGIGGVSMSSLAMILADNGVTVAGSDRQSSDNTEKLISRGIPVYIGFDPAHQDGFNTVVCTAALRDDDPELLLAKERGAKIMTRAELLGELMAGYAHSIGVAGTHGKSTTTGMLHEIFSAANADATVLAGAVIPSLNGAYRLGKGDTAVFEACEYKNSYHAMHPTIRLVLNTELDHVDFFGNMDNVISSFRKYLDTPSGSSENIAVINADCESCLKAAEGIGTKVYTFSRERTDVDFAATNIMMSHGYASFDFLAQGKVYAHIRLGVPGLHNVTDAAAAAACAYLCGMKPYAIEKGLSTFRGVMRRFERVGTTKSGALIFDDYAHHPDEIRATLAAAKAVAGGAKVICVFQPHTYTRFEAMMPEFAAALDAADEVILADIYAAREENIHDIKVSDMIKHLPKARYVGNFLKIAAELGGLAKEGDLIITMGAGDIYRLIPLIRDTL